MQHTYATRLRVVALALILALAGASYGTAAPGNCTNAQFLTPMVDGFEEISVSSTAVPLTQSLVFPSGQIGAVMAVCFIIDDAIMYREDGLVPTASVGMGPLAVNTSFTVCGTQALQKFRMIRVTNDADVSCTYYKVPD